MTNYTVVPIYKKGTVRYTAPVFYVSATSNGEARSLAKQSGLARFPEWNFHVIETSKVLKNTKAKKVLNKKDKNSKSQLGKSIAGHGHVNSRPVRRALRRLSSNQTHFGSNAKKAGAMKMW